jgi:O-antigen/teichoic acid export membrane protein
LSLTTRTIKGAFWAYAAYIGQRLFTLVTTAILARILVPADFGLVSFALLILGFFDAFSGFGIRDALIYSDEERSENADTAFWINIFVGVLQFVAAYSLAPLATHFFDDPRVVPIMQVMSVSFLFNAVGETHTSLLLKDLSFRRKFFPQVIAASIKGVVSIIAAAIGFGVWSLVYGYLASATANLIVVWIVMPWRPQLRFLRERAKSLWDYSVHILGFKILDIALEQADQTIIGVLLGATQLGYFSIASRIPEMIIINLSTIMTQVLFPAYSKLKNDRPTLVQGYLSTTKYTAFVSVGAGVGMAAVAPELIRVFFGDQWTPAVPLLQVLALLGTMTTLPWAAGDLFKAIGRPDINLKLLIVESLFTFPIVILAGIVTGLAVMVSLANLIAVTFSAILRLAVVSRQLDLRPTIFLRIFRSPFAGGVLIYLVVSGWRLVAADLPDLAILVVSILLGATAYGLILYVLEKDDVIAGIDTLLRTLNMQSNDADGTVKRADTERAEYLNEPPRMLWGRLTTPRAGVSARYRSRARVLSGLTLVMTGVGIIAVAGLLGMSLSAPGAVPWLAWGALPLVVVSYVFSRTRWPQAGAWLLTFGGFGLLLAIVVLTPAQRMHSLALALAVVPVLLGALVLMPAAAMSLTIVAGMAVTAVVTLVPGITLNEVIIPYIVTLGIITGLAALMALLQTDERGPRVDDLPDMSQTRPESDTRQMAATTEVVDGLTEVRELDALLREAVSACIWQFDLAEARIYLLYGMLRQGVLARRAGVGVAVEEVDPTSQAVVRDKAVIAPADRLPPGARAAIALPMRSNGRAIGMLDLRSDTPGAFDRVSVGALQTMADQIAAAIMENTRVYEAAQDDRYDG